MASHDLAEGLVSADQTKHSWGHVEDESVNA
jgi:hypothetical protein